MVSKRYMAVNIGPACWEEVVGREKVMAGGEKVVVDREMVVVGGEETNNRPMLFQSFCHRLPPGANSSPYGAVRRPSPTGSPSPAASSMELPNGYDRMDDEGKKYIMTPLMDSEGNEQKRLKITSLRDLTLQHGKKTRRHPNGRFLDLLPSHVRAWCWAGQSQQVVVDEEEVEQCRDEVSSPSSIIAR